MLCLCVCHLNCYFIKLFNYLMIMSQVLPFFYRHIVILWLLIFNIYFIACYKRRKELEIWMWNLYLSVYYSILDLNLILSTWSNFHNSFLILQIRLWILRLKSVCKIRSPIFQLVTNRLNGHSFRHLP